MRMASIRMNGSEFAVRSSGGSRLARSSTWYVVLDPKKKTADLAQDVDS